MGALPAPEGPITDSVAMRCTVCNAQNPSAATLCAACGSPLTISAATESAHLLPPGAKLKGGAYTVGKVLGQGGFGITYQGSEPMLRRPVGIKEFFPAGCTRDGGAVVLGGGMTLDEFQAARTSFLDEARTLARFQHPSIVRIFSYFEQNNTSYMVLELLRGPTLCELIARHGRLAESEAVGYVESIGAGLREVHAASLLHRDIKPENAIVVADGRAVLLDFGSAREFSLGATRPMTAMVTPGYAPLEQYGQRARFGTFSDIYALGATLYHLLTGQRPVQATDRASGVELIPPHRLVPSISRGVSDAVMWAMSIRVDDRPQSVSDFIDAIRRASPGTHGAAAQAGEAAVAPPKTLIVDPEGGDYRRISQALEVATPGTRIIVRPGLYRDALLIDQKVEIIGDGPARDIVIEERRNDSCLTMRADEAIVRNISLRSRAGIGYAAVMIRRGRLLLENCDITSTAEASCIDIHGPDADPIIRGCRIHGSQGSGVLISNGGKGTIEHCRIYENGKQGIEVANGGNPTIQNCRIQDQKGCGVWVGENARGVIDDCDIQGSALAGVEIGAGGRPHIKDCRIHDGHQCGVLVVDNGQGIIESCHIHSNAASGVEVRSGRPSVLQCTINGNSHLGVWFHDAGGGDVEGCDLTGNGRGGCLIEQGCDVNCTGNKQ